MLKNTLIVVFAIFLGIFNPLLASAAEKPDIWLQISPVANRSVLLRPKSTTQYQFDIDNIGKKDFRYRVSVAPYSAVNENYDMSFSKENNHTQISRWITFKNPNGTFTKELSGIVKAGKKATVHYKVSVPADIPAGGQYAVIFASPESLENANTDGIRTISRAGLLVYGRSEGNTRKTAELQPVKLRTFFAPSLFGKNTAKQDKDGKIIEEPYITGSVRIKNTGNTDFIATSKLTVRTLLGKTVHEEETHHDVLPDTERNIKLKWEKMPFFGIFQVTFATSAISLSDKQTKLVIVMPTIFIVLLFILLTALIAWIILTIRKRSLRGKRAENLD